MAQTEKIITHPGNKAYRDGWDRAFRSEHQGRKEMDAQDIRKELDKDDKITNGGGKL